MNRLFLIVVLLLIPMPSWAQASLLPDLQKERAKYGASMARDDVAKMLNAVAWKHRAAGWGLLSKGSGNSCPIANTFVSCDILVNSKTIEHFDVLIDAENRAEPTWNDVGPCVLGPSSGCEMKRFFAPVDPGDPPPPPPPPPDPGDVQALMQQIDAMFAEILALKARTASHDAQLSDLSKLSDEQAQQLETTGADVQRIDGYLADKPIPKTCRASLFGMPVGCKLEP